MSPPARSRAGHGGADAGTGAPWVKRFVAEPARAREAADLYRGLGHDVRLEPASAEDLPPDCGDCALARALYWTLYTRRRA
ncbi:MAG TPA: hypothetical protein VKA44_09225 [Gemmatimonadota bacterium]|nr:hypothetical protein [Gemmatimonadota bacterium]